MGGLLQACEWGRVRACVCARGSTCTWAASSLRKTDAIGRQCLPKRPLPRPPRHSSTRHLPAGEEGSAAGDSAAYPIPCIHPTPIFCLSICR